jgi:hypothetical protein
MAEGAGCAVGCEIYKLHISWNGRKQPEVRSYGLHITYHYQRSLHRSSKWPHLPLIPSHPAWRDQTMHSIQTNRSVLKLALFLTNQGTQDGGRRKIFPGGAMLRVTRSRVKGRRRTVRILDVGGACARMAFKRIRRAHTGRTIPRRHQGYRRDNVLFLLDTAGQGAVECSSAYLTSLCRMFSDVISLR